MKLHQATRQLQDAQRRVQVLEAQLKQKTEEASRLAADGQAHQARLQQAQEQVRRLDARLSSYDADKSKLQAVETQIGSLMVSAHMYSNRIISQAKQEAERITQQASLAIDQATNHIKFLSGCRIRTGKVSKPVQRVGQDSGAFLFPTGGGRAAASEHSPQCSGSGAGIASRSAATGRRACQ